MSLPAIGFVGVGRMGANMTRRLKDVGYPIVAVFDTQRLAAEALARELGAVAADHPSEVSRQAAVIFTVVTDDAAMRSIYFGENNLLQNASGKLFINCATISPGVHVEVAEAGAREGAQVLEAPMASSIPQARDGQLYLMLAGSEEAYQRAQPILDQLASAQRYVGKPGQAAALKALVNMVMNINTAGLAEGLGLAEAVGLDLGLVKEVFGQTGANSRVLETDAQDMIDREHSVYFSAAHAAKDSGIALRLAEQQGLRLPLLEASKSQFDQMVRLGLGELDKSGISELTFASRRSKD